MARSFYTLDVFTDRALAGNPLAVVLDSEGLDDAAMLAIAGLLPNNRPVTTTAIGPDK